MNTNNLIKGAVSPGLELLPILGAVGIITVISQYQVQLFWVGLAFNFARIVYMANKVYKFSRHI